MERNTTDQPFTFSTKRYDEKTGLNYYGYRYYNPAIGRWLTRDPLGELKGLNLYEFAWNNPLNFVDPRGLQPLIFPDDYYEYYDISIGGGGTLGNIDFNWNSRNPYRTSVGVITTPQLGAGINFCFHLKESTPDNCNNQGNQLNDQPFTYTIGYEYLGLSFSDNFDNVCLNFGPSIGLIPINVGETWFSF